MFTAEDYLQGWIVYSIGAGCLLLFLWLLLHRSAWTTVRHLLLLLAAAILLTPVTAYRDDSHLAPAFFVSLYEGVMLSGADAGFQRGLAPIIAVAVFAIIFYFLLRFFGTFISRKISGNTGSSRNSPNKENSTAKLRGARLNPQPDIAD